MEPPYVSGVAGGVGTTTLAAALRGRDCGIYRKDMPVHVLVCRSTLNSLGCAQRALQYTPAPPVLAVVDDVPSAAWAQNTANRIRMTDPHVSAVIRIPLVAEWRDVEEPSRFARQVLALPEQELSKPLRIFAAALQDLVAEVIQVSAVHPQSA